jgi:hypothetical protein
MTCKGKEVRVRWDMIGQLVTRAAGVTGAGGGQGDGGEEGEEGKDKDDHSARRAALATALSLKGLNHRMAASAATAAASGSKKTVFLSGKAAPELMDFAFYPLVAEALGRDVAATAATAATVAKAAKGGAAGGAAGEGASAYPALDTWLDGMEKKVVVSATVATLVKAVLEGGRRAEEAKGGGDEE